MCDETGLWQTEERAMECIVLDYFKSIFSSNGPTDVTKVVEAINLVVTHAMNTSLIANFRAE